MNYNNILKVLLVSPSPPPVGGIPSWTINILNFFKRQNKTKLYYVDTAVKYKDILEIGLWKRIIVGIRVTYEIIRDIKYKVHLNQPSIIHLTSSASLALFKDYLILRIAKRLKLPLVIHWHFGRISDLAIKKNWEWRLMTFIIRKSSYSIVIDNHSYKALKDAGFSNIVNIANPVSEELEKIALLQKNIERNVLKGKIVFVGHIHAKKGIYELVEACVTLDIVQQLCFIGPVKDEVKIALETLAKEKKDSNWLIFTGPKSSIDVYTEIRSAELLVLPSYTEGFPIVVIEAMAMGCAVVATDVGAISEMIDHGLEKPCGICVPVRNVKKLKEAIFELIYNQEKAKVMGQNGIEKVLKKYTTEKIVEQYGQVWEKVTQKKYTL